MKLAQIVNVKQIFDAYSSWKTNACFRKNLGKGSLTHFEPFSQNSLYNDVKTKHPWGISLRNAHFLRIPPESTFLRITPTKCMSGKIRIAEFQIGGYHMDVPLGA
jgi:hypothetical protein